MIVDGEIPADRFTYHSVMVEPSLTALVLVIIGNTFCLVVAVGFLSFNIHFRNNRYAYVGHYKSFEPFCTPLTMYFLCVAIVI